MNSEQLSMLEVAEELMREKKTPQPIMLLIKEVLQIKGLDDPEGEYATQLYTDITTSSNFVYVGGEKNSWDLKERQPLDVFDLDGSHFASGDDIFDDEEEIENIGDDEDSDYDEEEEHDYDEDDEHEYDEEDDEDEDDEENDYLDEEDETEDDDEVDYLDEEEYDSIMDDYEDMYDDN